ncbi:MAG: XrtX-associated membrane protein [Janthinobacterium lividum]
MSPDLPGSVRPLTPGRWLLAGLLAGALFAVGMAPEVVFAVLTRGWQVVFGWLGQGGALAQLQQGTSHLVTTRSLPAMATYGLLYVAGCLLLLHALLRDGRRTRWAAQVYLGLLGLCVLLLVGGRLGGNIAWAYKLGRRVIDFVISPLPVMILLPVLWPGNSRATGEKAAAQ